MATALDVPEEFKDVSDAGDGSALLRVVLRGEGGPCPGELAECHAHYRFLKETAKGEKVKVSTKEVRDWVAKKWTPLPCVLFDLKVADMGFKTVENEDAEPKRFVLGEGEVPECVEFVVRRLSAGGSAVLKLVEGALTVGRPSGALTVEVQLIRWRDPLRGPLDDAWAGLRSVEAERVAAEALLKAAEDTWGRIEALSKLKAEWNTEDVVNGEASEARRAAQRALRRYRRAARWLDEDRFTGEAAADVDQERSRVLAGTARALLAEQRRPPSAEGAAQAPVKSLPVLQAKTLAVKACKLDSLSADAQTVAGLAYAELGDRAKAREYISRALELDPHHVGAKSEMARINAREKGDAVQDGDRAFLGSKEKLDSVLKQGDPQQVKDLILQLQGLLESGTVSWDACVRSKVGKTIGEIQRQPPKGDAEVTKAAAEAYSKLLQFTDKKCRQLI